MLILIGLPRSPANRASRPPPRQGNTTSGNPDGTAATSGSDLGQSAIPAAFFIAPRLAVDPGLGATSLGGAMVDAEPAGVAAAPHPVNTSVATAMAATSQAHSNFRPVRSFRPLEPGLDVEFPTNADFSGSAAPNIIPAAPEPVWQ